VDLKERINSFMRDTDNKFSVHNYEYVLKELNNEHVKKVYK